MSIYSDYDTWKGWSADLFFQLNSRIRNYFDGELRGVELGNSVVLEMGFGNGTFLAYCKEKGAELYGTELLPELRERAQQNNVKILDLNLRDNLPEYNNKFDVVAAFDVLEHLTLDEIDRTLDCVAEFLKPSGLFIARFPNAQSPWGNIYQHGDMTHKTFLSQSVVQQLVVNRPFHIVRCENCYRPYVGSTLRRMKTRSRYVAQDLLEGAIHLLYGFSAPLGGNLFLMLRRLDR